MLYLQIYGLFVVVNWFWILYVLLRDNIEFVKEQLDENILADLIPIAIAVTFAACIFPIWWVVQFASKARKKREEKKDNE